MLIIDWSEQGLGNSDAWGGNAYFVFNENKAKGTQEIVGQWGLGQAMPTNTWYAVKRKGLPADAKLLDADAAGDDRDDDTQTCAVGCDTQDNEQE